MQYAEIISKEYLSQIFYFCLGKTGNVQSAEELTSDIYYEILLSLSRGNIPHNLSAWVWKIARNCYAKWVVQKKHTRDKQTINEESMSKDVSDNTDIEADAIAMSERRILYRELAFISKEYREIIVAHYFEGKSVSRIAEHLKVPVGTVKTRLQNGRKKLKEGMEMTREFGVKSYKAEEVHFVLTGELSKASELSELLGRKIPKNILLEAYRNPSTIENLSLELGIAAVYMEEEVQLLKDANLLDYVNGRYQTNFCIISRQAQEDIYNKMYQDMEEITKKLLQYLDAKAKDMECYEDQKSSLLLTVTDQMWITALKKIGIFSEVHQKLEAVWLLAGYEEYQGRKQELIILDEAGYVIKEQRVIPKMFASLKIENVDSAEIELISSLEDAFTKLADYIKTRIQKDVAKHLVNNMSQIENVMNGFIPRGVVLEIAECL